MQTRVPVQKRSIATRNKIIEKGFNLMCERGFYKTSTVDIAKYSKVSTGIIYQYFNDKKEIFLAGVSNYANSIMFPMINVLETEKIDINNLRNIICFMIDRFIETHTISKKAHGELMAMNYLDNDVANIFKSSEIMMTDKIVSLLKNNGFNIVNANEKVHIIIGIVDTFCHEVVYHKHDKIDYKVMKDEVVDIVLNIIK